MGGGARSVTMVLTHMMQRWSVECLDTLIRKSKMCLTALQIKRGEISILIKHALLCHVCDTVNDCSA